MFWASIEKDFINSTILCPQNKRDFMNINLFIFPFLPIEIFCRFQPQTSSP